MQTFMALLLMASGLFAIWVLCAQRMYKASRKPHRTHYYLRTLNSANDIEWVIRSVMHWSEMEGYEYQLFLIDEGSEDDTLRIIDLFQKKNIKIERLQTAQLQEILGVMEHSRTGGVANDLTAVPTEGLTSTGTAEIVSGIMPRLPVSTRVVIDLRGSCFSCVYNKTMSNQA